MRHDARRSRDFWAGALYVATALAAFWIARDYRLGTAARMGTGYFPMLVAGVLLAIGIASILRGLLRPGALEQKGEYHASTGHEQDRPQGERLD
jgi:hypothetical protein